MQSRGGWGRERSLKVRGEEIFYISYGRLPLWGGQELGPRNAYLIGRVTDTDVEIGQVCFYHVP